MTDDELARLRAVCEAATPGPWRGDPAPSAPPTMTHAIRSARGAAVVWSDDADDTDAIAALGSLWPELLAVVEAWSKARDTARGQHTSPFTVALDGDRWGSVCRAEDALRAAIRERLGPASSSDDSAPGDVER